MQMKFFVPTERPSLPIERPACERCGTTMWLARIQPSEQPDHDIRTFECPTCQTSIVLTTKFK